MTERTPFDDALGARLTGLASAAGLDEGAVPAAARAGTLADTIARGRGRRVARRRAATALAALVAVALPLGAMLGVRTLHRPAAPVQVVDGTGMLGTYTADITGLPGADSATGRWVLDVRGNGTIVLEAPSAYRGIVTGFHYVTDGARVRVDLFTQDLCTDLPVGTYTWSRTASGLRFDVVDDSCSARTAFLTGRTWRPGA